jgi:hypothetical protein
MVQANPQILQPMLQELGKQNPALLRLINENQAEFLHLINEAGGEDAEGDILGQLGAMPQSINVTPEEREAIDRVQASFFICTFFCDLWHRHLWLNSIHSLSDKQMVSGTICRIFIIKSLCEMYFPEQLEAMGFDRALVIEAFLACDKNEQLAANYLLEHNGDFEDMWPRSKTSATCVPRG